MTFDVYQVTEHRINEAMGKFEDAYGKVFNPDKDGFLQTKDENTVRAYEDWRKIKGRKGLWTFSINGCPSEYYCPTEDAAYRVLQRILDGRNRGPMISAGNLKVGGKEVGAESVPKLKRDESVRKFMTRGKLKDHYAKAFTVPVVSK